MIEKFKIQIYIQNRKRERTLRGLSPMVNKVHVIYITIVNKYYTS